MSIYTTEGFRCHDEVHLLKCTENVKKKIPAAICLVDHIMGEIMMFLKQEVESKFQMT